MAELLTSKCEVPPKKRKYDFQGVSDSSGQFIGSFLTSTQLSLQIPQNINTDLPVWASVRTCQVEIQWNITPYKIDICIVPLNSSTVALLQSQGQIKDEQECNHSHTGDDLDTDLASGLYQPVHNAEWIQQASFHTKPYDNIKICDKFLLGTCRLGFHCNQHHTPYPYHWQLRREDTYQWVSVSHSAQIKLEKLYCIKDKDQATLVQMSDTFTLDFEKMMIENSEVYGKVRRLSNTTNPEWNTHFPTNWQIYWWNDFKWEKYTKCVLKILLAKMEAGENKCTVTIRKQKYEVDFNSLMQTNLKTGFVRKIRRRPTFRSPHSLKPHLKTVILNELQIQSDMVPQKYDFDPLSEFRSWYPPVWTMPLAQDEFKKVDVPPWEQAFYTIYELFYTTMSEMEVEIVSIQQIQNIFQWDKYRRQKEFMSAKHSHGITIERHLFHGTTEESVDIICKMNFDPRVAGKNGIAYGRGSYFAKDASYSDKYAPATSEGFQYMFLAKVLVGKTIIGNQSYYRPPPLCPSAAGSDIYDTCVNREKDPSIFVAFDSCQCYPYYLIKYRILSDVVNAFE
uniref:TCDD-inducible poly [ADP-ribose] polymerase-like n=1 Tax=Lepisosteus oculatus TaxID=7918 RepID=W5NII2_LEPOC|nr:PREDICTED: TCDD-inducible poly [ADP-ribose] polymerase-like [Lepisosteus oculatus]XP_015208504.1 PREDICTED: TCDD-inducible poly [ADP-ribose] polymerase-like [Lepisosteus oculatus]